MRIFKLYVLSSLQIHSTVAFTMVTLLSIALPGLTDLVPASVYFLVTFL